MCLDVSTQINSGLVKYVGPLILSHFSVSLDKLTKPLNSFVFSEVANPRDCCNFPQSQHRTGKKNTEKRKSISLTYQDSQEKPETQIQMANAQSQDHVCKYTKYSNRLDKTLPEVRWKSSLFSPLWMSERAISATDVFSGSITHPVAGPSVDTAGRKLCSV